jgi:hypothetical protein
MAEVMTDLTLSLPNRPGTLAAAAAALANAGINIDGVCGSTVGGGEGIGHVLVTDAAAARQALQAAGTTIAGERQVLVAEVEDRPGTLAEVAGKLANAGINIDLLYLATRTRLVIGVPDVQAAQSLL